MKAVLAIALVAVAIAAPYIIPALLPAASALLVAGAIAAVEIGVALASSLLLSPHSPKGLLDSALSRLYATMVTTEPRKIVFGYGPLATNVRYQTYTGSKQEYYHQVIAHASHQVQSITELWIDNEKAWTAAGGVQGRYVGWLTVQTVLAGTSANGIAVDSVWTSTCTLTGCAYTYLKFKLLDTSNSSNTSPFGSGVSSRLTFRGKGAFVYDPRLDGTVPGGTGTQRAATQSTWAWDDNASRNPALQLLFFLLGWRINGKLALGMGIPSSRLDLPSFITAANHCDESVTLASSGTEPRYRSDGVISEGDDRSTVIENLCATMNATLRDSGGKVSLQVINNDLATPVAAFTLNDILGSEEYQQTQPLNDYFNIARGHRVDPSDSALYQLSDFPQVSLTSPDGIDRIQTIDFPLVQSNGQAQRLAKLRLKRAQFQARYTAAFGSNAWAVSLGNIVTLTHAGMNWSGKLFRVVAQAIAQNGQVKMTLLEEDASVYSWAAEDIAGITAGTPVVADPALVPVVQTVTGVSAEIAGPATITINADYTGTPTTALPFAQQYQLLLNGVDVSSTATWAVAVNSGTMTASVGSTGILSIDASSGVLASGSVTLTATYGGSAKPLVIKINKASAAAPVSGSSSGTTGGTTVTQAMGTPTTTTMTATGPEMDITLGTAGQAVLSADYTFTAPTSNNVTMQWYRWNGSSWVALGSSVTQGYSRYADPAEFTCSYTATGLPASSSQRFQLYMKEGNTTSGGVSGSGTMSAVGS